MFPILTIACGVVTASPLIVARKPNARELFERIAPYQGFFGLGVLALGIVWLIRWMPMLASSLTSIGGLVVTGMIAVNLMQGFLLGFSLLGSLLAKNETAREKSQALHARLMLVQVPLGITAVGLGVASFLL